MPACVDLFLMPELCMNHCRDSEKGRFNPALVISIVAINVIGLVTLQN